jgi:hypothetical protein
VRFREVSSGGCVGMLYREVVSGGCIGRVHRLRAKVKMGVQKFDFCLSKCGSLEV